MEPSPPKPSRGRSGHAPIRPVSVFAAGTLAVSVLVTGLSIATADSQHPELLGGAAAKFVPADGHAEWLIDNFGVVRMSESARSIGYSEILRLPTQAGVAVFNRLGEDSRVAQLWRESAMTIRGAELDEAGTQTTDLHQLTGEGLSLLAGFGGNIGLTYSPPLLELPSHVAPGVSWSSEGDAGLEGMLTYSSQFEASLPSNRALLSVSGLSRAELAECLQTDGASVYRDESGATLFDIVESDLWCVGRGRVAIVATVNGEPLTQGPMVEPPEPVPSTAFPAAPDWNDDPMWLAAEAAPVNQDAFFGEQQLPIALTVSPRRTQSGLVVAINQSGGDLIALRLESGALTRQWFAHPGGELMTLETAGDVTIVTTSRRRIVAYAEDGQRLWAMNSPELVLARPTVIGDGTVILVGLDGTVSRVDSHTGDLLWDRKLAADVSLPAVVDGGNIVVVDRAGTITAFEKLSGKKVWTDDSQHVPTSTFAASGVFGLAGTDGFVRAYDAADGTPLWRIRYLGFVRAVAALDGKVMLVTNEMTACIDVASGAVQWIRAGADDAVTDGVRTVLFDEASARLVDAEGATIAQWGIPSLALAINRYAVAGSDGFWVFRSNQPALAVGQP